MMNMQTQTTDTDISLYWSRLTDVQKALLTGVAKNFVGEEDTVANIPPSVMDDIRRDRQDLLNGVGKKHSWEEVKAFVINKHHKKDVPD